MSDKKNFILRIDVDTFSLLEKWAADDFRSVNGQIEYLLNEALIRSGRKKNVRKSVASQAKKK
ncbi:MAG: Arc family DNA binding domain-containing protein [Niabella sp.]